MRLVSAGGVKELQDDEIVQRFKNVSEWWGAGFYAPLSERRDEVERRLGIIFPAHYVNFVERLKGMAVPVQDILEAVPDASQPSWPKYLIPFFQDGQGNCFCFDVRAQSREGEYPIVFRDHELTPDENMVRTATTDVSFAAWAERYASKEISDKAPAGCGRKGVSGCLVVVACILIVLMIAGIVYAVNRIRSG